MAVKKKITSLTPGTWRFRFRAAKNNGIVGEWSSFFDYTVTGDTTPPPVPSKPFVTSVIGGVFVEWKETAYDQPIDFNRVDVYVSSGAEYTKFGSIASINSGVTYIASDGATGPFTFKFTGVDRSGNVSAFSEASDPVSAGSFDFDTTPPDAPSGLTVIASHDPADPSGSTGYVDVSWTGSGSSDALGYYIRYGRSATVWDAYLFIEHPQVTTRIFSLRSGTTYYFQVNATDGSNPTGYIPTTPVSVTIPGDTTAPGAPSGLVAVAGFNNIIAYWNRNSENDVDLGRGTYQFQLDDNLDFSSIIQDRTITGTVASFTGLTTGTTYYVRVRALDSSGNASAWTNPVSVTPGKINAEDSLVSGTIVGSLIAAETIVGDKLIANTIDADRLKTNTGIVGKLFVGDDAGTNKITIDGTAAVPAIYYGTGTFGSIDTPFYFDALGKFSLKDQLSWDGNSLTVKGSLNVTQASNFSANINILNGADILMAGGSIRTQTAQGKLELGSLGVVGYNAAGTVQAAIYANTGQLYAIGGSIGGWTISSGSLTTTNSNSQVVGLYSDGRLYMGPNFSVGADGSVTISGTLTAVGSGGNLVSDDNVIDKINAKSGFSTTNATKIKGGTIETGTLSADVINGGTITATITINTPNISMGTNNYWNSTGSFSVGNATNGSVLRFLPAGESTTIVTGGVNQTAESIIVSGAALVMKLDSYTSEGGTTGSRVFVDAARGNYDGTANDPTMVVSRGGQMTLGRTLYYAGSSYPNPNTSSAQLNVTNLDRSRAGDLYFTTGTI